MPTSSLDKQKLQRFVKSKVAETTQICVRKGVKMALSDAVASASVPIGFVVRSLGATSAPRGSG